MSRKATAAVAVAVASKVLQKCDRHGEVFYTEADPTPAFEMAITAIRQNAPCVDAFAGSAHELTDLLSVVIDAASPYCIQCRQRGASAQG